MAEFDYEKIKKPIIVRPSGIWDSRAPFHNFIIIHKNHLRIYLVSVLCTEKYYADYPKARADGKTLEEFLVAPERNRSKRAWRNYIKAQTERYSDGRIKPPIYSNTAHDLVAAHFQLKRSTVVLQFTLFEQYLQCWLLNYLLAKLENQQPLQKNEEILSYQLSPFESKKLHKMQPNLAKIMYEIPALREALINLDCNGSQKTEPSEFSSFDAINFWRQYRNALVHNRGYCTPKLYENQINYWNNYMAQFSAKDKFIERESLPLSDELLRHCNNVIYNAARALEGVLFSESNQRRGHPWAPNPKPANEETLPEFAGRLLVEGDHTTSYLWSSDENFREQFKIKPAQQGVAASIKNHKK